MTWLDQILTSFIWYLTELCHFMMRMAAHYNDVIMGTIAPQITSLTIVYSIVYSDADQRKHQSSASLAFVRGIHRGPVNSPHKWPVTRKIFPFDDVIMRDDIRWPVQTVIIICHYHHRMWNHWQLYCLFKCLLELRCLMNFHSFQFCFRIVIVLGRWKLLISPY